MPATQRILGERIGREHTTVEVGAFSRAVRARDGRMAFWKRSRASEPASKGAGQSSPLPATPAEVVSTPSEVAPPQPSPAALCPYCHAELVPPPRPPSAPLQKEDALEKVAGSEERRLTNAEAEKRPRLVRS
jgi:hypothetical protein